MTPLRLAFMGTPEFAAVGLRALIDAGARAVDLAVIARVKNAREPLK